MAVIDELIITLALDPTKFNAGQKQTVDGLRKLEEQAKTSGGHVEDSAQKMVEGFNRITKEVLGLGAAILGVSDLTDSAKKTVEMATAAERFANALDIDPEILNRWQNVGRQFQISAATTAGTIGALAKAQAQLRLSGTGPLLEAGPLLGAIGINQPNTSDPFKLLLQIHDALVSHPDTLRSQPGLQAQIASTLGVEPLLNMLDAPNLRQLLNDWQTATKAQIEAAGRISADWVKAAEALEGLANQVVLNNEQLASWLPRVIAATVRGDTKTAVQAGIGEPAAGVAEGLIWVDKTILGLLGIKPTSHGVPLPTDRPPMTALQSAWSGVAVPRSRGISPDDITSPINSVLSALSTPQWMQTYQQAGSRGYGGSSADDHSIEIHTINVTAPPGADPRTFGGMIASSIRDAMPGITGGPR